MSSAHAVTVPLAWKEAVQRTREALAGQGFGILSEIDVRAIFEARSGSEAADAVGDYVILRACSPVLASRAPAVEPDLGVLMPCNVVVRRGKDATETTIQAIDPQVMDRLGGSPAVRAVANEADTNLRAALASLEGARSSIS